MFLQKVEGRVASDQELKLTELLRYYMRDIQAAKVRHAYLQPSDRLLKFKFLLFVDIYYHRVELSTMRFNLICPLGKAEGENNLKWSELPDSHFPVNTVLEAFIFVVSSTRANYCLFKQVLRNPVIQKCIHCVTGYNFPPLNICPVWKCKILEWMETIKKQMLRFSSFFYY